LALLAAFSHSPKLRDTWSVFQTGRRQIPVGGCSYANRCPMAQPICSEHRPPFAEIGPGHFARCHFPVSPE
jgi:oligopeptide/dipeptide ABC transporter ATP-binding protein